jgi:signal transduction histidine kinase
MYAKLINKEAVEKEETEVAEFATQITKIASRASNMLRQLVDAARTERAMMLPVDLTLVIHNALALLSPQIRNQGINVQQHYVDDLPPVIGRPDQLEQVFINIGLNAFDAMPKGGDFTITVEPGNGTDNHIEEAGFVTIRLSDTGVGIPSEAVSLLFEPFYTTKERGAGSGLGLFVSHLIIDQHGGAIEVESQLGEGTTFILKLPTASKGEEQ